MLYICQLELFNEADWIAVALTFAKLIDSDHQDISDPYLQE